VGPSGASRDQGRLAAVGITQGVDEVMLNRVQESVRQGVVCLEQLVEPRPRQREDDGALAGTAVDRAGPLVDQA
jgi:hypothetical protein